MSSQIGSSNVKSTKLFTSPFHVSWSYYTIFDSYSLSTVLSINFEVSWKLYVYTQRNQLKLFHNWKKWKKDRPTDVFQPSENSNFLLKIEFSGLKLQRFVLIRFSKNLCSVVFSGPKQKNQTKKNFPAICSCLRCTAYRVRPGLKT